MISNQQFIKFTDYKHNLIDLALFLTRLSILDIGQQTVGQTRDTFENLISKV